ncbi:LOW QUALITY PROTEIN: hypothetical protein PanWU01x14_153680 [Parasponia andersonii]|uniref:Uncharacterized protein n=1 Tax=Parasponia andersonii TaxID=3476 RepID=A0A2P5CH55_PARAD|nr:LOW QUALITY PROTEIN: hypothetical protein PanWU01x14_153680 [Parasponia andersonii]
MQFPLVSFAPPIGMFDTFPPRLLSKIPTACFPGQPLLQRLSSPMLPANIVCTTFEINAGPFPSLETAGSSTPLLCFLFHFRLLLLPPMDLPSPTFPLTPAHAVLPKPEIEFRCKVNPSSPTWPSVIPLSAMQFPVSFPLTTGMFDSSPPRLSSKIPTAAFSGQSVLQRLSSPVSPADIICPTFEINANPFASTATAGSSTPPLCFVFRFHLLLLALMDLPSPTSPLTPADVVSSKSEMGFRWNVDPSSPTWLSAIPF